MSWNEGMNVIAAGVRAVFWSTSPGEAGVVVGLAVPSVLGKASGARIVSLFLKPPFLLDDTELCSHPSCVYHFPGGYQYAGFNLLSPKRSGINEKRDAAVTVSGFLLQVQLQALLSISSQGFGNSVWFLGWQPHLTGFRAQGEDGRGLQGSVGLHTGLWFCSWRGRFSFDHLYL